jgi:site-specific recombinase XerD
VNQTTDLERVEPAELVGPRPADRNPSLAYLARLGPGSRRTMRQALDELAELMGAGCDARTMPWERLGPQHTAAMRAALADRHAPATCNKVLSALRGVLRECWRLGLVSAEQYQRAADVGGVRGSTLPRGRALGQGELRALLEVCESQAQPAGSRNAALVAVAYGAGLRRAELVALDLGDFETATGELRVRHGKGRKQRLAYVTNGGRAALLDWIAARGAEPGPLFCPITKAGRVVLRRLAPQTVLDVLGRLAGAAGVAHFSPHDLRRTFCSDLLDAGADVASVQRLAGHANVATTLRYDRRPEAVKRRAAELLHVPYRGGVRHA